MSERALRDEIEALHAAILQERAKLAVPIDAELARARTALLAEIETLTLRAEALAADHRSLEEQTRVRKREAKEARAELEAARSEIGSLESLGNPLQESRSNWEDPNTAGCGIGVMALVVGAVSTLGWWLS